ncbi:hypothetical protein [Flavobacterium sp. LB1P71]|uniref:hypothetical protein n=1 Tax=unclassified Flavobacterium TaxID=196869 RepID=UPI003AAB6AD0
MLTLEEIGQKYHISKRVLETNLSILKPIYGPTDKLIFNGQKWLISESLIKEITERKYCKHYTQYDNRQKVDKIELLTLIKENKLKTFLTIAPKGIKSVAKIKDIVRDTFEYYNNTHSPEAPIFFIYGIEDNTDYLDEKQNRGYHIHAVTTANYTGDQQQQITTILEEQIGSDRVHPIYTVSIAPYVMDLGIGGLRYSLKENNYTGCYIK